MGTFALFQVGYLSHLLAKTNTKLPTICIFKAIVGRMPLLYADADASHAERNATIALVAKTLSAEYKSKSQAGLYRKKQIKQIFATFLHAGFKKILSKNQINEEERMDHAGAISSLSQRNV